MIDRTAVALGLAGLVALAGPALAGAGAPGHGHDKEGFSFGEPGDPKKPARMIPVTMKETDDGRMAYFPATVDVRQGEQIKFKVTNAGKTDHEFVLNTLEENQEHKAEMAKNPGMEHDDPNNKTVAPGKSTEVLWKFTKPGTYEYACLIPGHYESGMHAAVVVK